MKIFWTLPSINDLESIRDYIARDSEVYAINFVEKIIMAVEKLSLLPELGRMVLEADDPNVRELIFQNYRIIYRIHEKAIQIIAVIHGARDIGTFPIKPWEIV